MFRFGSIRSALVVDFENMLFLRPERVNNWLTWLEDGHFDRGIRRKFLLKRIYLNAQAHRHIKTFEQAGFEVIYVEHFAGLSNSADILMAMDLAEHSQKRTGINEYILITTDSDFVPVLQRLENRGKKTAIVADNQNPNIYTTYRQHADFVIPRSQLSDEAVRYVRPAKKKGLLRRVLSGDAAKAASKPLFGAAKPSSVPASGPDDLRRALDLVIKLTSRTPNLCVSHKKITEALLGGITGFATSGPTSFLGLGSFKKLMLELARRDERINVADSYRGGVDVKYVPGKDEA